MASILVRLLKGMIAVALALTLLGGDVTVMTGVDKLQEGTKVSVHFEGEKAAADDSRSVASFVEKLLATQLKAKGYLPK